MSEHILEVLFLHCRLELCLKISAGDNIMRTFTYSIYTFTKPRTVQMKILEIYSPPPILLFPGFRCHWIQGLFGLTNIILTEAVSTLTLGQLVTLLCTMTLPSGHLAVAIVLDHVAETCLLLVSV